MNIAFFNLVTGLVGLLMILPAAHMSDFSMRYEIERSWTRRQECLLWGVCFFLIGYALIFLDQTFDRALPLALWLVALSAIMLFDLRFMVIPDRYIVLFGVACLLLDDQFLRSIENFSFGVGKGIFCWLILGGLAGIYRKIRQREVMGLADLKLLSVIAAFTHVSPLGVLLIASVIALIMLRLNSLRGSNDGGAFAFAPCIIMAYLVASIWELPL